MVADGCGTAEVHAQPRSSFARLHQHPPSVVQSVQERLEPLFGEVLIDGLSRALPVSVIIDDHYPIRGDPWIQMKQFVSSGFVPVGIQAKERDSLGRLAGAGVLDLSFDSMNSHFR